jgi:hypothetical protein
MKKIIIVMVTLLFVGCTASHNPFATIGASKSINVGGIDIGVGVHDIIKLGK